MNFAEPRWLEALILVPIAALLLVWGFRRRAARLRRWAVLKPDEARRCHIGRSERLLRTGLVTAALALIVLALAGPRWNYEWREVTQAGRDIVVALDVSESMLAEDIKPSRLVRARHEIADLLKISRGDRLGLVVFAGEAYVQCPLTEDHGAVALFLDQLEVGLVSRPGTALGDAIRVATASLTEASPEASTGKAIILITDGEDQGSEPLTAAREAAAKGIRIYTVGLGAEGGAPIPTEGGGFKKNRAGEVVITRLGEDALKAIAHETGGLYVRSVAGDLDLERIYQQGILGGVGRAEQKTSREQIWQERFPWFLAAAALLLMGEGLLARQRRRRLTDKTHGAEPLPLGSSRQIS